MDNDILFDVKGKDKQIGFITLNRPKTLNALTHDMFIALDKQLREWENNKEIKSIIIVPDSERAFCAGGDVRAVYEAVKLKNKNLSQFFAEEYRLNRLLYHYKKPYIALLDGLTMGGGVGISMYSSHPIGTENLMFAMPETAIGFFPDVGTSYLLSRCPDHIGTYLALTGKRLNATECLALGFIKYFIPSKQLDDLTDKLLNDDIDPSTSSLDTLLKDFAQLPDQPTPILDHRDFIKETFSLPTVEAIQDKLKTMNNDWSNEVLAVLDKMSPTSLKVTLSEIQRAKDLDFDACIQMEYRLVNRFLKSHDFFEGIRALLIDKDKSPNWQPATLSQVSDATLTSYFQTLGNQELDFIDT